MMVDDQDLPLASGDLDRAHDEPPVLLQTRIGSGASAHNRARVAGVGEKSCTAG
jgi:hypothetical protein